MFLLDILLHLFMGNKQQSFSPEVIVEQLFIGIKKIIKSLILLLICSVFLCVLLGYLIDRTLTLVDGQNIHLSNSIILLIVLIIVDLVVIFWALKKFSDKSPTQQQEQQQTRSGNSPLESAVAALVFDFVKGREANREAEIEASRRTNRDKFES